MWPECFISDYCEVPEGEVWGQGVGGGDAVDDGGEDGTVEKLHHGEHLQEGLVEEHHQHHRAKRDPGGGQARSRASRVEKQLLLLILL